RSIKQHVQSIKENFKMKTVFARFTQLNNRTKRILAAAGALAVIVLAVFGLFATGTVPPRSLAGTAAGSTCTVRASGATSTTIQAAVNDAGCATINVAAGTYYEWVTISRAVTINGVGATSTIVDGIGKECPSYPCTAPAGTYCATYPACTVFTINQPVAV